MTSLNPGFILGAKRPVGGFIVVAALCVSASLVWRSNRTHDTRYVLSPGKTLVPALPEDTLKDLPYPPHDALPGARDVETPYGSIRVYEWGPEDGERVLFVHGISTPALALGNLAHEMVSRGYRVMMFDLFGRGYSDAPNDLTYDARLYVTQLLLVLASSNIPWMTPPGFRLVGYSLGGGLCVSFTRYFPHLIRSLCLIAPSGLIRRHHTGWWSWLYYNSGLLPEFLVRYLVRRRIRPDPNPVQVDIIDSEGQRTVNGDGDSTGGAKFDNAVISKSRPHVTVSSVVAWQVDHHEGFVMAFLSSIRNAPIFAPQEDWGSLAMALQARRSGSAGSEHGLEGGKVLMLLGREDGVIVIDEAIEDVRAALGHDGVDIAVFEGGHELPITSSAAVAAHIDGAWRSGKM
ncbi:alpha/beta-hydrolase [Xylaria nigripes]|nr:alpha/beta-hydrolase [Xylaria nigripes]